MEREDKKAICENAAGIISEMYERFLSAADISFKAFSAERTVLAIVDVVNGFIREGAMSDSRIESVILPIKKLLERCNERKIPAVVFSDCHSESSAEFSSFPPHCIKGGSECEIVDEIKEAGGYITAEKNSTNGFYAPVFTRFLLENKNRTDYIVCGDCTDICVMNFCLSLKTYFDQNDIKSSITVPVNMTETYSKKGHDGDFMKLVSLEIMKNAGIKIVGGIGFD
ncbi:MAG: cysteine hydrolase family protein [Porcipelethomonas sp.]